MLKKSARLTTKQFNEVLQKGRVHHSSLFLVRAMSGQSDKRVSAVAPVKIAKKAYARNSIRRKIYAVLRSAWPSIPAGLYAIVFAKKDVSALDGKAWGHELALLLHKAGTV